MSKHTVMRVWMAGQEQYVTIPPVNVETLQYQIVADIVMTDLIRGREGLHAQWELVKHPTTQTVLEGQENWNQTFEGHSAG